MMVNRTFYMCFSLNMKGKIAKNMLIKSFESASLSNKDALFHVFNNFS